MVKRDGWRMLPVTNITTDPKVSDRATPFGKTAVDNFIMTWVFITPCIGR